MNIECKYTTLLNINSPLQRSIHLHSHRCGFRLKYTLYLHLCVTPDQQVPTAARNDKIYVYIIYKYNTYIYMCIMIKPLFKLQMLL